MDNLLLEEEEDYEVMGDSRNSLLIERDNNMIQTIKNLSLSPHPTIFSEARVGTPLYMSPEIWTKKHYSKGADVWALGVILYELLVLKHPFPATTKEELKNKVCNDPIEKQKNSAMSEYF